MNRKGIGLAEAAEITHQTLWHTTGSSDDIPLNRPQGFCLDQKSELIYVADTDNNRVMKFALDGQAIGQFYTSRPLERPFDLVIGPSDKLYISQIEKEKVEVFDKKGIWQASLPKKYEKKISAFAPGRMGFDYKGRLLVTDRRAGVVWLMTLEGNLIRKIYEPNKEKKNILLTGLTVDPKGKIYIVSAQAIPAVTVMNPEGIHILSFGQHAALYEDSFSFPNSIAVDEMGKIWVVDALRHSIKVFDPEGKYIFSFGAFNGKQAKFMYPVDIDIDKEGIVYVLEKGTGELNALSFMAKDITKTKEKK